MRQVEKLQIAEQTSYIFRQDHQKLAVRETMLQLCFFVGIREMKDLINFSNEQDTYCGTRHASKLLEVSVGTVHNLLEANKLVGWKTQGGHRRISLKSIHSYLQQNNALPAKSPEAEVATQVLIVEDDENTRAMYQAYFHQWNLPLELVIYASAIDALSDLHALTPMILLTDLHMSTMDGFEFITTVRKYKALDTLPIIAITGMTNENITDHGGLDGDVMILKKPIDMEWLKGLLQGIISMRNDMR